MPASLPIHRMQRAEGMGSFDILSGEQTSFWGQSKYLRREVAVIRFRGTLQGASKNAWDVSEAKDRSVLAWMQEGTLYVASEGRISPNPDGAWLFAYFTNLKSIDFGDCFDTSEVTDFSGMFIGCENLAELDTSCFNTSKAMLMGGAFSGCQSLTGLDLSGFKTENITQTQMMFAYCGQMERLDLSGFSLIDEAETEDMFYQCANLKELICGDNKIREAYQNR